MKRSSFFFGAGIAAGLIVARFLRRDPLVIARQALCGRVDQICASNDEEAARQILRTVINQQSPLNWWLEDRLTRAFRALCLQIFVAALLSGALAHGVLQSSDVGFIEDSQRCAAAKEEVSGLAGLGNFGVINGIDVDPVNILRVVFIENGNEVRFGHSQTISRQYSGRSEKGAA